MLRASLVVFVKELTEAVRDRRSLASALFYAVWGPLAMALALMALARDRGADAPLTLAVADQARAASLVAFLAERRVDVINASDEVSDEVRDRKRAVALLIGDEYPKDFQAARPAPVTLLYDGSWTESSRKADRVRTLLAEYAARVSQTRLVLRGISPRSVAALDVEERDLSTDVRRAATVLGTLPIFVLLAAFIGGMGVAADLGAGERERGSLESLLIHPVPRGALAAGKFAAAALLSLATVTLTLLACRLVLQHPRVQAIDLPVGLSAEDAAEMWVLLAPLALFAAAVQLFVALLAKTYKEAQTQLSLLLFVPMLPGFMFAFGALTPEPWMAWLPVLGQQAMISDVLRGQPLALGALGLTLVTLAAAGLAVLGVARLLDREAIVRTL